MTMKKNGTGINGQRLLHNNTARKRNTGAFFQQRFRRYSIVTLLLMLTLLTHILNRSINDEQVSSAMDTTIGDILYHHQNRHHGQVNYNHGEHAVAIPKPMEDIIEQVEKDSDSSNGNIRTRWSQSGHRVQGLRRGSRNRDEEAPWNNHQQLKAAKSATVNSKDDNEFVFENENSRDKDLEKSEIHAGNVGDEKSSTINHGNTRKRIGIKSGRKKNNPHGDDGDDDEIIMSNSKGAAARRNSNNKRNHKGIIVFEGDPQIPQYPIGYPANTRDDSNSNGAARRNSNGAARRNSNKRKSPPAPQYNLIGDPIRSKRVSAAADGDDDGDDKPDYNNDNKHTNSERAARRNSNKRKGFDNSTRLSPLQDTASPRKRLTDHDENEKKSSPTELWVARGSFRNGNTLMGNDDATKQE